MLNKIQGRPFWYKVWTISFGIAAIYVLIKVFTEEGLAKFDYFLMFYTNASILLDIFISRFSKGRKLANIRIAC
ncbi:hypothetical protein CK503_00200 [Aliifodinibius salipaludis]|uniref:Uncharacterized protein n=1 Tax=Fodinibius salipaludis TaxID=2032627 RepID=A0A2A2GD99_9BACT|nr:hypothetical protein CK503_00200 [Aliifodinibius salipaludis]